MQQQALSVKEEMLPAKSWNINSQYGQKPSAVVHLLDQPKILLKKFHQFLDDTLLFGCSVPAAKARNWGHDLVIL
jgi:hypothetical protein